MAIPLFEGHVGKAPGTCASALKSVALTVLELLAFGLIARTAAHRDKEVQRTKLVSPPFTLFTWWR